jgi:CxC2 like cysteine cluster associated with KDZ transposases
LKEIGLRVQLGHRVGDRCVNPKPATGDDFVVIDVSGVHKVGLDYCSCTTALETVEQLLRVRWFPATTIEPKTAATFNALEHFQLLTFELKASVFEFYRTLMRRMDNTNTVRVPVSNESPT